ncbi:hypothetical protein D9X91_02740 [Falsibacillus albus]|uniref:Abortive phage infection protein n=2 Tax=Falsibacillus albus TaxID=2478915 RepID=A0A3L7K3C9_9BACI|nr:hypothetical protein D9X91_02740 [Falsibacillus albus]
MDTLEQYREQLDKLQNGDLDKLYISKEEFLPFRQLLVARPDFKHFFGIAQRGGGVIYTYMPEPRS